MIESSTSRSHRSARLTNEQALPRLTPLVLDVSDDFREAFVVDTNGGMHEPEAEAAWRTWTAAGKPAAQAARLKSLSQEKLQRQAQMLLWLEQLQSSSANRVESVKPAAS